jgi:molecular chaperone HtpG
MTDAPQNKIAFEVETARVLEILSKEIYDSPLALLRENVQNAYDATLMRSALERTPLDGTTIEVRVEPLRLTIIDAGIGMTEEVLRNNFWKAGSSGKKTELARQAGVIGTFGIGAMANFGVCRQLRVETRAVGSDVTLVSMAEKARLSFSEKCIDLEEVRDGRSPGTTLVAELEPDCELTAAAAKAYLQPYVAYLRVRVMLNGQLISGQSYEGVIDARKFEPFGAKALDSGGYQADVQVYLDKGGQTLARLTGVKVQGTDVAGDLLLVQGGGQLLGLRNNFGLAPVPVSGHYQFGGVANLSVLQPTAGREALSRESISHVAGLVALAEQAVTEVIAATDAADRNASFQQYLVSHNRLDLAGRVTVAALPEEENVHLAEVSARCKDRTVYYYGGHDQTILQTFASAQTCLLHLSQSNPRRKLQQRYLIQTLRVEEVPDRATVIREYRPTELTIEEASLLARVTATLNEDYLLSDVTVLFADISHGVDVLVSKDGEPLCIWLGRDVSVVKPVLEAYRSAYEVFGGFVKDFVRNQLYQRLASRVPSSTREGADALARLLRRNRELYRYEESELGNLEPLLGEWLAGEKSLSEVLTAARSAARPQTQTVSRDQVGSLEEALPDVAQSPAGPDPSVPNQEFEAAPSIIREDVSCDMKILLASGKRPQLNNFEMFLGLSDRLMKREGEFFRYPHTTKIIWAGHRIIYIFTEASGKITLYYDIELKDQLDQQAASGGMFPTTTLVTKNRIYVPVPALLEPAFRISEGAKEFFVRFDTIMR